jgi:hypothetical protein
MGLNTKRNSLLTTGTQFYALLTLRITQSGRYALLSRLRLMFIINRSKGATMWSKNEKIKMN